MSPVFRRLRLLAAGFALACSALCCNPVEPDNGPGGDTPGTDPGKPTQKPEAVISFYSIDGTQLSELIVPPAGGNVQLVIESNADWNVFTGVNWLVATPNFGSEGSSTITLKAAPNTGTEPLSTEISFTCFGTATGSASITANQQVFEASTKFVFNNDPGYAFAEGGAGYVEIDAEEDWTAITNLPWLSVSPKSGGPGKVRLVISSEPNSLTKDREAELRLTYSSGKSESVLIKQHADVFTKKFVRRANILQAHKLYYDSSVKLDMTLMILPYPETNQYQVITNSDFGTAKLCTSDTGFKYLMDYRTSSFPPSGSEFIYHRYTVDFYTFATSVKLVSEPNLPYDTESAEYKRFTSVCTAMVDDKWVKMVDPTHPKIVEWSDRLWEKANGNHLEYARACANFVAQNFKYGIFDFGNSIDEIVQRMSGDCGNMHVVWMSLVRCKGIPARPILMLIPSKDGEEIGTHARGEFYLAGYGWIPLDINWLQDGFDSFGKFPDESYVVMNNDFSLDFSVAGEDYNCSMLQVIWWILYCSGNGNVEGEYIFKEL